MKFAFIDIDNTLLSFDDYVKNTLSEGFKEFGIKKYEPYMYDVFEKINGGLWRQIEEGEITFEELSQRRFNDVFSALDIEFDGIKFEKYFRSKLYDSAIVIDGAKETLSALKEKCVLCVASNGPFEQQLHRLEIGGLKEYFDFFFMSERLNASKPSKEFFKKAFSELKEYYGKDINKNDTIMIGDSLSSDIKGGKEFGMTTCLYTKGGKTKPNENVDYVVDKLIDIINIPFFRKTTEHKTI